MRANEQFQRLSVVVLTALMAVGVFVPGSAAAAAKKNVKAPASSTARRPEPSAATARTGADPDGASANAYPNDGDPDLPPGGAPIDKKTYLRLRDELIAEKRGALSKVDLRKGHPRGKAIKQMEDQENDQGEDGNHQKSSGTSLQSSKQIVPLINNVSWTPIGPNPLPNGQVQTSNGVGTGTGGGIPITGRTISIAIHPTNANIVYIGTANGGIFRSTDGGTNWAPIFDTAQSLAVGSLAISPASPTTLFVGTGEGNLSGDSFFGVGVYRIDNADTTPVLNGPFYLNSASANVLSGQAVSKIVVDPADARNVFVTTTSGIAGTGGPAFAVNPPAKGLYRCTNALGASPTFERLNVPTAIGDVNASDIAFDPSNINTMVVSIYDTTANGGGLWRTTNALAATPAFTLVLALNNLNAHLAANKVGAVVTMVTLTEEASGTVHKSIDGGATWGGAIGGTGVCDGQCFYDSPIAIDPTDANFIWRGGSGAYQVGDASSVAERSTNGGTTFSRFHQNLHPDNHAFAIAPSDPNIIFCGNDGGIFKSVNAKAATPTWASLANSQTNHLQFDDLSQHSNNSQFMMGGTQDNGTQQMSAGSVWQHIALGDGGFTVIDQSQTANPVNGTALNQYHTYYNQRNNQIGYEYSTTVANAPVWNGAFAPGNGIALSDYCLFYAPMEGGPLIGGQTRASLYFGTDKLYRSVNGTAAMTLVSQSPLVVRTAPGTGNWPVSAIAIATGVPAGAGNAAPDDNYRLVGMRSGQVFGTITGSAVLTNITSASFPANPTYGNTQGAVAPFISRVAFDPNDKNTAYVVMGGYGLPSGQHVWKTTAFNTLVGTMWSASGTGIPDVPVDSVAISPSNSAEVYVGTDIGVYRSTDSGSSWTPYNNGLPRVPVFDIGFQGTTKRLRIATYGRGIWEIDTTAPACTAPSAPTLNSAVADCNGVNLSWTVGGTGTTNSYNVYRAAGSCPAGALTKINATPITSGTTYSDTTAVAGTTYAYVIRGACDVAGTTESANSNCLSATRLSPPAAPTGVTTTPSCPSKVDLAWTAAAGATSYNILRGTSCGTVASIATGVSGTTYSDTTPVAGTPYVYVIQAVNSCGTTNSSCTAAVTTAVQTFHLQVQSTFVAGYKDMTNATQFEGAVQQSSTTNITAAGEYQIGGATPLKWISPAYTKTTDLGTAPWTFDMYGLTNGTGAAGQLYAKVYRYNGGAPVLLFTTGFANPNISTASAQTRFTWNYTPAAGTTVLTGDRIFVEIWVHATAGAAGGSTTTDTSSAEVTNVGSVSAGTIADTTSCNGTAETLRETTAASNRNLDHVWTVGLTTAGSRVFNLVARVNTAAPLQGMLFQYSTSQTGPWTDMMTITNTAYPACGSPATFAFNPLIVPTTYVGNVYIRITRVTDNGTRETVDIDYLAVVTTSAAPTFTLNYDFATADSLVTAGDCTGCTLPGAPTLAVPDTSVNNDITLNWSAGSPAGTSYNVYRTAGAACGVGVQIATGVTGTTYTDSGIPGGTQYSYEVTAVSTPGCESARSNCRTATATGGPNLYSNGRRVSSRPEDTTSAATTPRWIYSTGAASLVPPGIGSVYAVSNDRVLHGTSGGVGGGVWSVNWKPLLMNSPSQARPTVTGVSLAGTTKQIFIGTQDGFAHMVDGVTGTETWKTSLGEMVQGAVTAIFTQYGGAFDLAVAGTRNSSSPNSVNGLDPASGAIKWTFDNNGGVVPANAMGMVTGDLWLDYGATVAGKNKIFFATRALAGGSSGTVWCLDYTATTAALCSEPGSIWPASVGDIDGTVTLFRGRLYVGTDSGSVIALDPKTGQTIWSMALGDGPIKGYVEADWNMSAPPYKLFVATTNQVTIMTDNGPNGTVNWTVPVPGAAVPIFTGSRLVLGGSDGKLYEISNVIAGPPTTKSVTLGTGLAAIGDPTVDWLGNLIVVGSEDGRIYAVQAPLP